MTPLPGLSRVAHAPALGRSALLLLVLATCAPNVGAAAGVPIPDSAVLVHPFSDRYLVEIGVVDAEQARAVVARGIDVDAVELPLGARGPGLVRAYVNDRERAGLERSGLVVQPILDEPRAMAMRADAERRSKGIRAESSQGLSPEAAWPTYTELQADLEAVAEAHPGICQLVSLGNSVQGRPMWIMKITRDVGVEGAKPEFKFTSSMHGDEDTGMELCRRMIHYLAENDGIDPRVTSLVDSAEIWICPLHNPDGYANVSRYNANGIDLNRVFPDPLTDPVDTPDGRPLEDRNFMLFGYAHHFVLSANYHGGALVVNYPWDCQSAPLTPDNTLIRNISLAYASTNVPMWNSPSFFHGVTEGADWYVVHGGMQDWCYQWRNEIDLTIEVSTIKKPNYNSIDSYWNDNRESMLAFMERTFRAGVVRGIVTDAVTGVPLSVTVDVGVDGRPILSDPDVGDYHRMLEPGNYTFTFMKSGYDTRTFPGVVVTSSGPTVLDVAMMPAGTTSTPPGATRSRLTLSAPRPNPALLAAGPVQLDVTLPEGETAAAIYDLNGRRVRSLAHALRGRSPGTVTIAWDGRDERGQRVPGGLYWVRVRAGSETAHRRVAVLR